MWQLVSCFAQSDWRGELSGALPSVSKWYSRDLTIRAAEWNIPWDSPARAGVHHAQTDLRAEDRPRCLVSLAARHLSEEVGVTHCRTLLALSHRHTGNSWQVVQSGWFWDRAGPEMSAEFTLPPEIWLGPAGLALWAWTDTDFLRWLNTQH